MEVHYMAVLTYNGAVIGKSSTNNGILTLQRNGSTITTFSADQASNTIANIEVPTKISDLTDDVVDGHYLKLSTLNSQTISSSNDITPLTLKSNSQMCWIGLTASDDTELGFFGANTYNKPLFYDGSYAHELAVTTDLNINISALNHNTIFRGKNLGTVSSIAHIEGFLSYHKVSTGEFYDLYLGDYFTIEDGTYNGVWMVAGFDIQYNKGNNPFIGVHHVVLIPRTTLGDVKMNSTNTTGVSQNPNNPLYATTQGVETAGYQSYYGSDMNQIIIPTLVSALETVLGNHLLSQNIALANATTDGMSSGWNWYTVKARLMSEINVYGSVAFGNSGRSAYLQGTGYDTGLDNQKLPVFNYINSVQYERTAFWLRGVSTGAYFCRADNCGLSNYAGANHELGLRPQIIIGTITEEENE